MPEISVAANKAEHRRRLRDLRAALSPALVRERSRRAAEHLLALPLSGVRTIAIYAGSEPHGELDPRDAAPRLRARGLRTVFPRTVRGEPLRFSDVAEDALVTSPFGVLEPREDAAPVELSAIDAFVVPGLGFTEDGMRLGFGGGYYDRTLAARPTALRIGYAHEDQIVPSLPTEAHDARLDLLVTHDRVHRCPPRSVAPGAQP